MTEPTKIHHHIAPMSKLTRPRIYEDGVMGGGCTKRNVHLAVTTTT